MQTQQSHCPTPLRRRLRAPPDGGAAILGMCRQLDFKTQEERLKKLWAGPAYSSSGGGGAA